MRRKYLSIHLFSLIGILLFLSFPLYTFANESSRSSCTLTISSDKHTSSSSAAQASGACNGLISGYYADHSGDFVVSGAVFYNLKAGEYRYLINTPSGPTPEAELTVYTVLKEIAEPKPEPVEPAPAPEEKPKPSPAPNPKPEEKPSTPAPPQKEETIQPSIPNKDTKPASPTPVVSKGTKEQATEKEEKRVVTETDDEASTDTEEEQEVAVETVEDDENTEEVEEIPYTTNEDEEEVEESEEKEIEIASTKLASETDENNSSVSFIIGMSLFALLLVVILGGGLYWWRTQR